MLLKPGADPKKLEAKFPAFVDKYIGTALKAAGFYKKQFLIPVKDLHLYSGMTNDISSVGTVSNTYLYILASIALFTLLIACINFMNLSTAVLQNVLRKSGFAKCWVRRKESLVKQFLGESVLMSMIAFIIALCYHRDFAAGIFKRCQEELSLDFSKQWFIIVGFFLLSVLTGLLAGSYPAFYLSSFKP